MAMKKKNLPELVPQVFEHEQFGNDALRGHVDDEDKNTVTIRDAIPGNPNMVVINKRHNITKVQSKLNAFFSIWKNMTTENMMSSRFTKLSCIQTG